MNVLYRERILTCPRCEASLRSTARRELWPCGACGGVAVDAHELARTIARYAPTPDVLDLPAAASPSRALLCAACNLPMQPLELHGIRLDRCDRDRLVWLDAHQLDVMIDAAIADHEARKGWGQRLRDLLFAN